MASSLLWDNLWYAGQYPLGSYSLLYYFPAAIVGNLPLVLAAAVAGGTLLFAAISYRECRARAPAGLSGSSASWRRHRCSRGLSTPTRAFAAMLAALRLLQRGKTWLVIACAILTLGVCSAGLCFPGQASSCRRCSSPAARPLRRGGPVRRSAIAAIAAFELVVLVAFPTPGTYPFNPYDFVAVMSTSAARALLRPGAGGRDRLIGSFFVTWATRQRRPVAPRVPSAVGDNWTRLRAFVFPLMLIAALQARFRPRWLAVTALSLALAYNLIPYLMLIPYRLASSPQTSGFWQPAVSFLDRDAGEYRRVEVLPTAAHRESYSIQSALARGWYRQLDEAINPVLYRPHPAPPVTAPGCGDAGIEAFAQHRARPARDRRPPGHRWGCALSSDRPPGRSTSPP